MNSFLPARWVLLVPFFALLATGLPCLWAQDPGPVPANPAAPVPAPVVTDGKEYADIVTPKGYTEDKPAYCYFKKLTINRASDRRLEITAEMQGKVPHRDMHRFTMIFFVDIDQDMKTGASGPGLKNFGEDIQFGITRNYDTLSFDGKNGEMKVGSATEEIEVKKIEARGNTITFTVYSPLFVKYPNFHFYATTSLITFDRQDINLIKSDTGLSRVPATGTVDF